MSPGAPPNYYAILEVSETATQAQIRDAYKRAALKTHPDRVPAGSPERAERTRKFQLVNDAYFCLSNTTRRREYDEQRRMHSTSTAAGEGDPYGETSGSAGAANAYSWAWNFFTSAANKQGSGDNASASYQDRQQARQETEEAQWEDVFDEMMREEGMAEEGTNAPTGSFWSMVGGVSGGALGFIVANVPGMVAGAVAGNRLGAIRDARGKSVYAVFQELPADDKARILSQLAARVFSHAVGV